MQQLDWENRYLNVIDLPRRCPDCGGDEVSQVLSIKTGLETYRCDGCGLEEASAEPFEGEARRTRPVPVAADYLPLSGYCIW
jgi:rubredoxin